MTNVQSIVTPVVTNGTAIVKVSAKTKAKAQALNGTAVTPMTAAQAIEVAFESGTSMAGVDGSLTIALKAFKDNESVQADMLMAFNVGYMMKKLGYDKHMATITVNKLKYNDKNEKKNDDNHRTFEEQRVCDTVRVIWHRAKNMAGIVRPKSEAQVKAATTAAAKEIERKEQEVRLQETWNIVHPDSEVDVNTVMSRFVSTMRNYHNGNAAKFTGDDGSAWREWLAAAPSATRTQTSKK